MEAPEHEDGTGRTTEESPLSTDMYLLVTYLWFMFQDYMLDF